MEFEQSVIEDWVVLGLAGHLGHAEGPLLVDRVRKLTVEGSTQIVLDLTRITSTNATGAGALVRGLRVARASGGDLRLSAAGPELEELLELHQITRIFRVHHSVTEAIIGGTPTLRRLSRPTRRRRRGLLSFSRGRRGRP